MVVMMMMMMMSYENILMKSLIRAYFINPKHVVYASV